MQPGERPEKFVEIPKGPRIRIAAAPEPDAALVRQRERAVDEIERLTGWEGVRRPEGLEAARARFPASMEASLRDASDAPKAWRAFALSYAETDPEQGKRLASEMEAIIMKVSDPGLRWPMLEALDAMEDDGSSLGDMRAELLGEIGKKRIGEIDSAAQALRAKTEKKQEAFANAERRIDDATARENGAMLGFREQVATKEAVARDNLSYFEENGYLAL